MISFQQMYRKSGIRTLNNLTAPIMNDISIFALPVDSILHWCDFEGILYGPNNNELMFKGITKPIQVMHELSSLGTLGNPRTVSYIPTQDIRDYHMRNKRTRLLRNIESAIRDPQSLVVFNYSPLLRNTKYVKSYFSEYHKWYNIFDTITKKINEISLTSTRQHFLSLEIPKVIPSMQQLNLAAEKGVTTNLLKVFNTKEAYVLLELWKWIHPEEAIRKTSLFSNLETSKLMNVNFIILESNKYSVLNLGYLFSFLTESKIDINIFNLTKQKIDYNQLQKRLLRLVMTVMEVRTVTLAEKNGVDVEEVNHDEINAQNELAEHITGNEVDPNLVVPPYTVNETEHQDIIEDDEDEAVEAREQRLKDEDNKLDEELALLNEISKRAEDESTDVKMTVKDIINTSEVPKLEDGIIKLCDKLADDGMLSAAEYKRYNALAVAYQSIPLPNGKEGDLLHEFVKIDPEVLKITEPTILPDNTTVFDKTMLKTSLGKFDSEYIYKVLSKDVFSMALNMQHAGIAVTDYKVEKEVDILGSYETHIIKVKPVIGKESTLRFKIPVLNKDGIYVSNNVKYRFRKQRGDLPIRKIKDNEVALTSYYGKSFINRGRRKTSDYGNWLVSNIMSIGLNPIDNTINEVTNSNVFYKDLKLPRAFTAISKEIKTFTCKGYTLNFDYSKRDSLYPAHVIKNLEKHGSIILGINKEDSYLVIDMNNTLYTSDGNTLEVFGSIEQFLNLNQLDAPVEYAEISVFGKSIPVGVALAYYLGLEKLIKSLKINVKRIQNNARVTLSSNEWSLQFQDETLVFNRDDKLASLILGGFNSYHKAIRMFSIYSFNNIGVYVNLFEANGLSARFIRELDLMNKMFIDPITREILIDMKEPTTFQGLLFRACELLLVDQHPDALDPKYMRIKGYERIAGSVYTELVQSIRYHEGRLGKASAAIEMNPFSVWKRITEDPSKTLVNEINPIESLKELEAVTFAGTGGRNKRSMVKSTRAYHNNDMGVISESTVDSTDVGINMFTSANPQFTSLRGLASKYNYKENGVTSLVSTSALLGVGSNHED